MLRGLLSLGLALAVVAACGVNSEPGAEQCRQASTAPTTIAYAKSDAVPPDQLSLDIYLPAGCGPVPVIVWVHGGGWLTGDKTNSITASKVNLAETLNSALVAVNYRLSGIDGSPPWPENAEDLATAIAWIVRSGREYDLDPERISLLGHSAGAHLAAIVATDPQFLRSKRLSPATVDCVVALDSTAYNLPAAENLEQVLIARAFGDLSARSDASPLIAVERYGPPAANFLVVARGSSTRVAAQQQFVDTIVAKGGQASLVDVNPYDHSAAGWQLGIPGEQLVTIPVTEFLAGCLG